MKKKVVVRHGYEPWKMSYDALASVFEDDVKGKTILVKPNVGRIGKPNFALCTGHEVVRGVVRFLKDQGAGTIYVGDGALWGTNVWEALKTSGIMAVCEEEGVTPVNLDEAPPVIKEIPDATMIGSLKFSSLPFEVDMVISVPVIKTHMYATATLSIKNMKGCLYKLEKTRLHRLDKACPDESKGRCLDWGVADMSSVLLPDYAVMDGTTCMEGFGPSAGDPINLDLVVASKDPTAADYTAIDLMGFAPDAVKHVNLVSERCGTAGYNDREVDPPDFKKWGKTFRPAELTQLGNDYPNITLCEKGACSACSSTTMMFIKAHGKKFPSDYHFKLCAGKDLTEEDMQGENVILVGNCTAKNANGRDYCKGCPPIGSMILAHIRNEEYDPPEKK